jgi:hypothetical protein
MSAASFCCRRCCSVCRGSQTRHLSHRGSRPAQLHRPAAVKEGFLVLLLQSGRGLTAKAVSSPMGLWRLCIGVTVGALSSVLCSSDRSSAVRRRSCGRQAEPHQPLLATWC